MGLASSVGYVLNLQINKSTTLSSRSRLTDGQTDRKPDLNGDISDNRNLSVEDFKAID